MKTIRMILLSMLLIIPSVSRAAFLNCGDTYNYGYNTSTLFAGLVYTRLECNVYLISWYENMLAGVGSSPLDTYDSRQEKLCYFDGYYDGLVERVAYEYEKCYSDGAKRFSCIPRETLAMYAANILIGVNETLKDLTEVELEEVFNATPNYPVCEEVVAGESCAERVTAVLTNNMYFDDEDLMNIFITQFCPLVDEPDGGV